MILGYICIQLSFCAHTKNCKSKSLLRQSMRNHHQLPVKQEQMIMCNSLSYLHTSCTYGLYIGVYRPQSVWDLRHLISYTIDTIRQPITYVIDCPHI
jgi:hypothetical protein